MKNIFLSLVVTLLIPNVLYAQSKTRVVASPKNFEWCDFHVCQEPAHYLGAASYYGKERQGRKMANGQRFDYRKLTAACWFLPLGTQVEVTNLKNGKTVTVEITDRGPAHRLHRVVDLSQTAAERLEFTHDGLTKVWVHPVVGVEPYGVLASVEEQKDVDNAEVASIIE